MGFKDLVVWQKAYELSLAVYKITAKFPRSEIYGLTSQFRRAAVSILANIAEGYERQYRKEYLQFLTMARGSLGEVETYILLCKDLKYLSSEEHGTLESLRQEVGRLLRGLVNSLS